MPSPSEEIKQDEEGADKKKKRADEIAELTENVNLLVGLVKQAQERDEQTRALITSMQEQHEQEVRDLTNVIESVGDKSRVMNWRLKTARQKPREYKICTYNGKVVTSWDKMVSNLVYKNELKATVERLTSKLHYEDGSAEEVEYTKWQMDRQMIPATYQGEQVIPNEKNPDKPLKVLKLKVLPTPEAAQTGIPAGKEYNIEVTFLN